MNSLIIGTAGHIDHGKSSLIKAMNGFDGDELALEKEKGITINLSFSHLQNAQGANIAFIDVPGHENLIKTMISGAFSFSVCLFVVDINEGLKAQSVEHLQILRLLGCESIVLVLSKCDLCENIAEKKEEILKKGYPPAVREICEAVNLKSTSSVHSHLETLEKNGYIRRDPTKPRAIEILDDNFNLTRREMVNIPIIGRVAAGEPLLAEQNIEDYFPIPVEYMPNKQTFMLQVQGESMINAGILSGDYVIVEQTPSAENGEQVVALIEDGATVKTFYREEGIIRLQPENDAYDPIILTDVTILGKVIGVIRMY